MSNWQELVLLDFKDWIDSSLLDCFEGNKELPTEHLEGKKTDSKEESTQTKPIPQS